ncbi:MAG TPA: acyltransferase [Bacteroidetes bacterium]|nr:acyltransferase [Bacteroidota bacterium]
MFKVISEFFKLVKGDLGSKSFWFALLCSCVNLFPGKSGSYLRTLLLTYSIGAVGKNSFFLGNVTIIHPDRLIIGKNVLLNKDLYVQASGKVDIDDFTILGPSVKIWSLNHVFIDPKIWIPEQGYEYLPVKIGKHVWVGANVFIMPGTTIGDYCIVSAGSVVGAKVYPPGSILAGNPARKIGTRILPDDFLP